MSKKNIKVCYVSDNSSDMTGGARSQHSLMVTVRDMGVDPFFVTHKKTVQLQRAEEDGIKTLFIPAKIMSYPKGKFQIYSLLMYLPKRFYNLRQRKKMVNYLKENKFDLVHINSFFSCIEWADAARKAKIPYVWHLREYVTHDHNRYIRGKQRYKFLLKHAARILTISKDMQKYWSDKLGRRCDLVYNGLEVDTLYKNADAKLTSDTVRCAMVGRVAEGKRQLDAVNAIKLLRDKGYKNVSLVIVGYRGAIPYELEVKKYITDNHLEDIVELVGFTDDVSSALESCDIGLICSNREAFGRVTIEYMLAGLLAIGSDSGGTPELITNDKTGLLYAPSDASKLAEKIEWVLLNKNKAKELLLSGQKNAVENFSIRSTAENVYRIYQEVLKSAE